jgi:hypothetical protein
LETSHLEAVVLVVSAVEVLAAAALVEAGKVSSKFKVQCFR